MGRFPVYPLLAALYPVVLLYSLNWGIVPAGDVIVPLSYSALLTLGGFAILWIGLRNLHRTALVAGLAILATYTFSSAEKLTGWSAGFVLAIELILLLGCFMFMLRRKPDLQPLTAFLNLLTTILILLPIVGLMAGEKRKVGTVLPVQIKTSPREGPAKKPDIFYIVVDGYGRADQLRRVMGFDNSSFVGALRKKGFSVIDDGHSNYCQTELSISSTLNMSFLQDYSDLLTPATQNRLILDDSINKSFVAQFFRSQSYRVIGVSSGFPNITFKDADAVYRGVQDRSLLQTALLEMTPFASDNFATESMFDVRRKTLNAAFDNLESLAEPSPTPRLVLAHILAPHPPFVFDAEGNPVRQRIQFGYVDGSDYMDFGGTPGSYTQGYAGQLQYVNKRLLKIVEAILSKATADPIIIIAGDHGSKERLDQARLEKTDLDECFSNLQALHLPPNVAQDIPERLTPVNFFRLILKDCFHQPISLLPNKSFYSPFPHPYQFTDVTDQLK